jgi:hypothetical protein
MLYAYDKNGMKHAFHHPIDWKTVIKEKGFTANPPGTHIEPVPEKLQGEQIEGIEVAPEIKPEVIEDISVREKNKKEFEKEKDKIIGERIPREKAKGNKIVR